jgi:hypothetical protein
MSWVLVSNLFFWSGIVFKSLENFEKANLKFKKNWV